MTRSDDAMGRLLTNGWAIFHPHLGEEIPNALRESAFADQGPPGRRSLLDHPTVRQAAILLRTELIKTGFLPASAVAIQAITFDKTPRTNWKVTWHQDLMFPFARPVTSRGFELPTVKEGIDYARPPQAVLEDLLVVRLHLDDCDPTNGPLRVSPGSHRRGILKGTELSGAVAQGGEVACRAKTGEALLMRPLLLHASSPATAPKHRRVLHLVYHSGQPIAEPWHRAI